MNVQLTLEEAAHLQVLAESIGLSERMTNSERKHLTSASAKLRGALERSGARLRDDKWIAPPGQRR